jgi:DNA-binding MarR family transcriptional regulator
VLDRLEAAGHIRRVRDELDRRRIYVEVTPETLTRMHALYYPLAARSRERMAGYTAEELALFRDWVRLGKEITLEHAERLRAMLEETREREGAVDRVRRTAKEAKRDMKSVMGEVKRVAKDAKTEVKQNAKGVKTDVKRVIKGR